MWLTNGTLQKYFILVRELKFHCPSAVNYLSYENPELDSDKKRSDLLIVSWCMLENPHLKIFHFFEMILFILFWNACVEFVELLYKLAVSVVFSYEAIIFPVG